MLTPKFIGSPNFTPATNRGIDLVVIHTIESAEKGDSAESCARWFQSAAAKVSAHYCVDNNSIVQCVKQKDVAWCAPGANHNGIHIEHAGRARQSPAEWRDDYSVDMLIRSAEISAEICRRYSIPVQYLGAAGVKRGLRGITTHAAVSLAFKKSNHTDPGRNFPIVPYIQLVKAMKGLI